MRVAVRDLRNDTRSVIDAVERGEEVVLTRRGQPVARIVAIEPEADDIDGWLDRVTSDPADSGWLDGLRAARPEDDAADDRRLAAP